MRHTRASIIGSLAAAAFVVGAVAAAPADAATTNWTSCPYGYFCVWNAPHGTGRMCKWQGDSPDWFTECSWGDDDAPASVYNHGKSGKGVTIYEGTNYYDPIGGCVLKGEKVNLAGTYYVGSHRWDC